MSWPLDPCLQACTNLQHKPCRLAYRYSEVQKAVENNLRKQAQVLRGIDANMRSFGDLLQQSSQATEVSCAVILTFAHNLHTLEWQAAPCRLC